MTLRKTLTDSCFGTGEGFFENSTYFYYHACQKGFPRIRVVNENHNDVSDCVLCPLAPTAAGAIFITTRSHGYSSLPGLISMFVVN